MNEIERETVILNTGWGMIDDLVNWGLFVKRDDDHLITMMFHDTPHRRLFAILLVDFLSVVRTEAPALGLLSEPSSGRPSDRTFLFHLRQVCASPQLGSNSSDLHDAVEAFATWLEKDFVAKRVNFGDLGAIDLKITRLEYLKMCGDIAKHNVARLSINVKRLANLLKAAGYPVSDREAYRQLDAFFTWFFDDILIYHASSITKLLNDIRWLIHDYLAEEYRRSWHHPSGKPDYFYAYRYPKGLDEPVAQGMYWDLMNRVRAKPWIRPFTVSASLTSRY